MLMGMCLCVVGVVFVSVSTLSWSVRLGSVHGRIIRLVLLGRADLLACCM